MFDAHAELKRLAFHANAALREHPQCISCRMANGQQHARRRQRLPIDHDAADCPVVIQQQVVDPALKSNLASKGFDALPDAHTDIRQPVAANVWMRVDEDVGRGAVFVEYFKNVTNLRAVQPRIQLSITVGPRPPLAVEQIGLGIEVTLTIEPLHDITMTLAHRSATLQYDRVVTEISKS